MQMAARVNAVRMPGLSAMTAASALTGSNAAQPVPSKPTHPAALAVAAEAGTSNAPPPITNRVLAHLNAVRGSTAPWFQAAKPQRPSMKCRTPRSVHSHT